jgi:hypothetical protein
MRQKKMYEFKFHHQNSALLLLLLALFVGLR